MNANEAATEYKQVPATGLDRKLLEFSAAFGLIAIASAIATMGALMHLL